MVAHRLSRDRAAALRRTALSLEKNFYRCRAARGWRNPHLSQRAAVLMALSAIAC